MSLNSLQDDMSRRAASMAAMAKRANNPQEIQAIQQSLVTGVQNGSIQAYVGIPLIQELTQKLTAAKAQMAQAIAGAGMQQPQDQQGAPIAQQVMQQAAQESQGVEALPSNLPQEYAGGGIIAFEEGGEVEHYVEGGSPASRWWSGVKQNFNESNEAALLRNKLQMLYGPKSAVPGLFMDQTDAERQMAKDVVERLDTLTFPQLQALEAQGPSALPPIAPAVKPPAPAAPPAAVPPAVKPPAPAAPAAPRIPGADKFVPPTLQTYTPIAATLPVRADPVLTDLDAITKDMPKKTKEASEDAVTKTQKILEDFDKPGNEAREAKYNKREAEQEKNSAMTRALNLMNLGFGIAGSKERSVAGALNKEGREGIQNLIQGEAANRAARERLDDARDNFEQQKVQAKKGNYQASQTAGREASRDVLAATQFALTGAQAGNAQAISLYGLLQQGDIGKAGLSNQAEQLKLSGVDQQNRNVLGIAGLEFQNRQLNQAGAIANANIAMQEKRYAAMDKTAQARIQQVQATAFKDFTANVAPQLNAQFTKEYGPNWRTAQDKRSLEAQLLFKQQQQAYMTQATGSAMDALSARSADDLLMMGQ